MTDRMVVRMTNCTKSGSCQILIGLCALTWLGGCAPVKSGPRQEKHPGLLRVQTRQYEKTVEGFAITPQEAAERVKKFAEENHDLYTGNGYGIVQHDLIVDGSYLFSRQEKMKVTLSGFFVDGHTGEVRFMETDKAFSIAELESPSPNGESEPPLRVELW